MTLRFTIDDESFTASPFVFNHLDAYFQSRRASIKHIYVSNDVGVREAEESKSGYYHLDRKTGEEYIEYCTVRNFLRNSDKRVPCSELNSCNMRRPRLEIQGGLYHIITRGNNRQLIFGSDDDYRKFLHQLANQEAKVSFYLYAYCLMPNHIHLLVERRRDSISRIMQRLLTSGARQIFAGWLGRWSRPRSGHL